MTPNLSLLLLTHNESENIKKNFKWLNKCKTINEIIVVDDNSADDTKEELKKLSNKNRTIQIFSRGLDGDFSVQRAFGISQAKNNLIFWLDADEYPSNKLIQFLNHIDKHRCNSYAFKRQDNFLGKELKHGETVSQSFIRLFNKKKGSFIGKVHERWASTTPPIRKNLLIFHYSHQTLQSFIQKINFYSDIRAQELFHQKIRPSLFQIILYPLGKFIQDYFFELGFLDSTPGIILALGMSFHSFLVRAKLWHLYQK